MYTLCDEVKIENHRAFKDLQSDHESWKKKLIGVKTDAAMNLIANAILYCYKDIEKMKQGLKLTDQWLEYLQ